MRRVNFLVQINNVFTEVAAAPNFGFYKHGSHNGYFSWILQDQVVTGVPNKKEGVLLENWTSGFTISSVDIRREGRFASVGSGNISVDNAQGQNLAGETRSLQEFLDGNGIYIEGCEIVIHEVDEDGTPTVLYTGIVAEKQTNQATLVIKFDDASRYRNTKISRKTPTGEYFPVVFGELDKAKFIKLKELPGPIKGDDGRDYLLQVTSTASADVTKGLLIGVQPDPGITIDGLSFFNWVQSQGENKKFYVESFLGKGSGKIVYTVIQPAGVLILSEGSLDVDEEGHPEWLGVNDAWYDPEEKEETYLKIYDADLVNVIDESQDVGGFDGPLYTLIDGQYYVIPDQDNLIKIEGNEVRLVSNTMEDFGKVKGLAPCELLNNTDTVNGFFEEWGGSPATIEAFHERMPDVLPPDYAQNYTDALLCDNEISVIQGDDETLSDFYIYNDNRSNVTGPNRMISHPHVKSSQANTGLKNAFDDDHNTSVSVSFQVSLTDTNNTQTPNYVAAVVLPLKYRSDMNVDKYRMLYDFDFYTYNLNLRQSALYGMYNNFFQNGEFFNSEIISESKSPNAVRVVYRVNNNIKIANFNKQPLNTALNGDTSFSGSMPYSFLEQDRQYYRHDMMAHPIERQDWGLESNMPYLHRFTGGYDVIDGFDLSDVTVNNKPVDNNIIDVILFFNINARRKYSQYQKTGGGFEGLPNGYVELILRALKLYGEIETDFSEGVYAPFKGRTEGDVLLQNPMDIYRYVCKLQNYSNSGVTRPAAGWGLEIPEGTLPVAETFPEVTGEVANQLLSKEELETKVIKDELLKTMWCFGALDEESNECVYKMLDAFNPLIPNRLGINYDDIIADSLSNLFEVNKADIFCQASLEYAYDVGLEEYTKAIEVTNVDAPAYDPAYVTGPLNDAQKGDLWHMGNQLYRKYGIINDSPTTLTSNKWIRSDIDAYSYLKNWLAWQGASTPGNYDVVNEKREINFDVAYDFAKVNGIKTGRFIELKVPHFDHLGDQLGVITKAKYELRKGREVIKCTALVKTELVKAELELKVMSETGIAAITVDETGTRTNEYNEQG